MIDPQQLKTVITTQRSGAILDDTGKYRYALWRNFDMTRDNPPVYMTFIMLNPSTADAEVNDPTIRRCMGFAERERCSGIVVGNLFAFRATQPSELTSAADARGPDNVRYLEAMIQIARGPIVAAWGSWWFQNQSKRYGISLSRAAIETIARRHERTLWCLGRTKDNQPRHPLYVKADQELEVYS